MSANHGTVSPMKKDHLSIEIIRDRCGKWNTDVAAGWAAGLQGKQRLLGKLVHRRAPLHLYDEHNRARLSDWNLGYRHGRRYRETDMLRQVWAVGQNADGEVTLKRKGWGVSRGALVTKLEQMGCGGDVLVLYFEGGELCRTVRCGI